MSDIIFIVDPTTKQPSKIEPVSFSDLGIKERQDLEEWVKNHSELLGSMRISAFGDIDYKTQNRFRLGACCFNAGVKYLTA